MPAFCVLCCSACASRSLASAGASRFLQTVDRFEPGIELFELVGHGANRRLQGRFTHSRTAAVAARRAAEAEPPRATAPANWSIFPYSASSFCSSPRLPGPCSSRSASAFDLAGQRLGHVVARRLRLAVQEVRSDLLLGLVQHLAEGLQSLCQQGQNVGVARGHARRRFAGGRPQRVLAFDDRRFRQIRIEGRGELGLCARLTSFFLAWPIKSHDKHSLENV